MVPARTMIATLAATLSAPALARDCSNFVGELVSPLTYAQAVAQLPKIAPKDEFETTIDYQKRIANITNPSTNMIIHKDFEKVDGYELEYNADRQVMKVHQFLLHNYNPSFGLIWSTMPDLEKLYGVVPSIRGVGTTTSVIKRFGKSKLVQNGFGAAFRLTEGSTIENAIYEGPSPDFDDGIFEQSYVGEFHISPESARLLKTNPRTALVIQPKLPFFISVTGERSSGSIRYPFAMTTTLNTIFADIKCALILAPTNRVVASFATK